MNRQTRNRPPERMDAISKSEGITNRLFVGVMPPEIAYLPKDKRGFPIPAFVHVDDNGIPDFRIIKPSWRETCHNERRCWICGGGLSSRKWFVIGPMCSVTRTTSEPPSHRQCAEFAARNCPFLASPLAKRNTRDLPEEYHIDGTHIDRNPGVAVVWECRKYKPFMVGSGWLIEVGEPEDVKAWREGRPATRAELLESVMSGLPLLKAEARKEGPLAERAFRLTLRKWRIDILDRYFSNES